MSTVISSVSGSSADDNEIDWIDYDNDGDVDPYVSGFRSSDKLFRNNWVGMGTFTLTDVSGSVVVGHSATALGADVGDRDNDGDMDIIIAEDANANEVLLNNTLNVPDPIAPRVPNLRQLPPDFANSTPRLVVATAFDNANLEYFINATGTLDFTVNGNPHSTPAHYAGGNMWRATIPGYWHGNIGYSLSVTDRVGNTGTSATKTSRSSRPASRTAERERRAATAPTR
jgi:hypothetical protein